ncbi:MAG: DUF2892 domain-containing protein [Gammaproteobacteria bacterium]|nr:DUF2892 domain-containing protein [Gammaproteobacteria bacterium]
MKTNNNHANKKKFINPNQVVGTIDCMFRGVAGLIILVASFAFSLSIFEMTELFSLTIYLWLTGITGWDPFYAIFYAVWRKYKANSGINGRF